MEGRSYCCPGAASCSILYNDTATQATGTDVISFAPNTYPVTGQIINVAAERLHTTCEKVSNNGTREPWPPSEAFACGRGNFSSYCYAGDTCVNNIGEPIDSNNDTLLENFGAFCCPNTTRACPRTTNSNGSPSVVGCADEAAGESCCATQVCPADSKCCAIPSPPSWDTSEENSYLSIKNYTNSRILSNRCCPNGTFCCAILLPAPTGEDGATEVFTYCGRNENCTSIATMSEVIQPMPVIGMFFPDYVERLGWIEQAQKVELAAGTNPVPNTCDCINAAGSNNFPGRDQTQLDLDVRVGTCEQV